MKITQSKISKCFVVPNELGIHVRPATLLAKTAKLYQSEVQVHKAGQRSDGKSIMQLLMLAAAKGDELTILIVGNDAPAAMLAIEQLFAAGLGEK